jgi:hypothetical protein
LISRAGVVEIARKASGRLDEAIRRCDTTLIILYEDREEWAEEIEQLRMMKVEGVVTLGGGTFERQYLPS